MLEVGLVAEEKRKINSATLHLDIGNAKFLLPAASKWYLIDRGV
jgi:hypothetical protein